MKKLVVWWQLRSMSEAVAKKSQFSGQKIYRKKPMRSEFPPYVTLADAQRQLEMEYGARPIELGSDGMPRSLSYAHKFVHIVASKIVDLPDAVIEHIEQTE